MTTGSSAQGGFLPPLIPPPTGDLALDVAVQATLAGVLGFDLDHVRPRVQPVMPPQFETDVSWVAFAVTVTETPTRAAIVHHPDKCGYDELQSHETLTVLISFYGPFAQGYYGLLRDGIQHPQNREAMAAYDLRLVDINTGRLVPAAVNGVWQRRTDCELRLRRQVNREYPVYNIIAAQGTIEHDAPDGTTDDTAFYTGFATDEE